MKEEYSHHITVPCCPFTEIVDSCGTLCSICGQCNDCNQCNQCLECNNYIIPENNNNSFIQNKTQIKEINEQSQSKMAQNNLKNYKLQLFNKDKEIKNYAKQLEQQNKKLEALDNSLKIKDRQISDLQNTIKELNLNLENQKKEIDDNNELIDKYKYQIETHIHTSEQNQNIYDNNYNSMNNKLEENKSKINELEKLNNKLNTDINQLQKEIYSKNEIIENNNLLNTKLSNENKNLPLINKKLIEYENKIKLLNDDNINLKKYNLDLINENNKLNQKLNQLLKDNNQKENNSNIEIYNVNSKLNKLAADFQVTSDELQKIKLEKDMLIQEREKFCNFVNNKLNDLNKFIIDAFNAVDTNKFYEQLNNNKYMSKIKYSPNVNDIQFELIENSISEMKKNILKNISNIRERNDKYINSFNNISRDRDILESHNSEMLNELNIYKQNQNEIENKNKEIALNYENLKDSYTKLYNDYHVFTNSNAKYVNDMQSFFIELIEIIKNTLGEKIIDSNEKPLKEILNIYISRLINEYKLLIKKIEENEKKDEITYQKIMELGSLLEESQKVVKQYEEENRRLKQEIERLNYRYNLLKASIDTVEYKIKNES